MGAARMGLGWRTVSALAGALVLGTVLLAASPQASPHVQKLFGEAWLQCKDASCLTAAEQGLMPKTGAAFGVAYGMRVGSDDEKLELSMEVKEPKPPTECNGVKMAPGLQKCGTRCDYGKYLKNVRFVQVPSGMDAAGVGLGGRR